MKWKDFLRDRLASLLLWGIFIIALEVMLMAVSQPFLQIYIGVGIPLGFLVDLCL